MNYLDLIVRISIFVVGAYVVFTALLSAIRTFLLPRAAPDPVTRVVFSGLRRVFDLWLTSTRTYEERDRAMAYYGPGTPHAPDPKPTDPISITREQFDYTLRILEEEGVPLKPDRDQAWRDFAGWRVNYDAVLLALAKLTMAPPAPWSSPEMRQQRRPPLSGRGGWGAPAPPPPPPPCPPARSPASRTASPPQPAAARPQTPCRKVNPRTARRTMASVPARRACGPRVAGRSPPRRLPARDRASGRGE